MPGEQFNLSGVRPNYLPAGLFGRVFVRRLVCCECGYTEEWVEKPAALQKIKARYRRVTPPPDDLTDKPLRVSSGRPPAVRGRCHVGWHCEESE